jgi:hypothetical protein
MPGAPASRRSRAVHFKLQVSYHNRTRPAPAVRARRPDLTGWRWRPSAERRAKGSEVRVFVRQKRVQGSAPAAAGG